MGSQYIFATKGSKEETCQKNCEWKKVEQCSRKKVMPSEVKNGN